MNRIGYRLVRWRALDAWERRLFLRLLLVLPATWLFLRLRGFARARSRAECALPSAAAPSAASAMDRAQRSARIAALAARSGFFRASCLVQSLALCRLLRRQGLAARLKIGVRPDGGRLDAHAWVELDAVPLGQAVSAYSPFLNLERGDVP